MVKSSKKQKQPNTAWVKGDKIVDSFAEAIATLNIGKNVLQAAKRHPKCAQYFRNNGRVNLTKLEPLLKQYEQELNGAVEELGDQTYWRTLKIKYDALMAEKELDQMKGKYLLKEDVDQQIKAIAIAQKALLKSKLTTELPQQLLGLTVPEIAVSLEQVMNDICYLMASLKVV